MCISLQSYHPGTRISTSLYNENLVLFLFIGWILWFGFFFLLTNDVASLNVCKLTPMVLELIAHWDKFWLNFMSAFYILSIAYLSDIWFTDISPVFFLMEYFEVKRFFFYFNCDRGLNFGFRIIIIKSWSWNFSMCFGELNGFSRIFMNLDIFWGNF